MTKLTHLETQESRGNISRKTATIKNDNRINDNKITILFICCAREHNPYGRGVESLSSHTAIATAVKLIIRSDFIGPFICLSVWLSICHVVASHSCRIAIAPA